MVAVSQHIFSGRAAGTRWDHVIENLFGAGENCLGHDHSFFGEIRHAPLGQVEISKVVSSRERSRRTPKHVTNDRCDCYILVGGVSGTVTLQQGGVQTQIAPRGFVFYCASRPYEWQHMHKTVVHNIAVPDFLMKARLRNVDQYAGRSFANTGGMWRIVEDMIDSTLRELHTIPDATSYQLGAQIVDLLSLALEGDGRLSLSEASSRNAVYQRCVGFIRGNLLDSVLGPELIANTMGVSVRSLHRIFAENGTTVTECIREERLAAAMRYLQNPGNAEISISEVAYRTGFRSHSHFSQAFRAKFGVTPSDWRRRQN
jgi:AraC-like DNA-binding protein